MVRAPNRLPMNVLITGGLGFIGSGLANRLCGEHSVTVLSRSARGASRLRDPARVRVRERAIEAVTAADVEGADLVIHCASTVHNYHVLDDPKVDVRTNCDGTLALLEACKVRRPRLLFVSTFFVYGNPRQLPVDEDSPCEPLALYPATKLAAEHFCSLYGRLHDFHVNVCRLTNVYGPGEAFDNTKKGALNFLMRRAQLGEPIGVYGGGEFVRDYLYVDDAVEALWAVATKGARGERYLAGYGEPVAFKDIIEHLLRLTGRRSPVSAMEPPRFHDVVGIKSFAANTAKLRALGWAPRVGIEEGLRRTLESYEQRHP